VIHCCSRPEAGYFADEDPDSADVPPALDEFELPERLPLELRRESDVVLPFLPEFAEPVLRSLLLVPGFDLSVLSVVELAPVLPGVCGVAAGAGGAFCPHA